MKLAIIAVMFVFVLAGCYHEAPANEAVAPPIEPEEVPPDSTEIPVYVGQETIVEITSTGFNPETVQIPVGDKITFVNEQSSASRPASDVHPTHTVYPGSSAAKCGTAEESSIFDACKELAQGENYSFIFNEAGVWTYHDHLNPSKKGSIIVQLIQVV